MITFNFNNENFSSVVKFRVCIHEEHTDPEVARERFDRLVELLNQSEFGDEAKTNTQTSNLIERIKAVKQPEPAQTGQPPRVVWTDEEMDAIKDATSPKDAADKYFDAFPEPKRTRYAVIKRYEKVRTMRSAPKQTGEEVTLHDPVEEIIPDKVRKNAWLLDEDSLVRSAQSPQDAALLYKKYYGDRRTAGAIYARWAKLNPGKPRIAVKALTDKPAIGTRVMYRGMSGVVLSHGKSEIYIALDKGDSGEDRGRVWVDPVVVTVLK